MIDGIEVLESLNLSLTDEKDQAKLMSLIKGKNYIVKFPVFVVYCADEEGMRIIYDCMDGQLSGKELNIMQRKIVENAFIIDDDELTFETLSEILEKNVFDMLGSVDVEVTEHLVRLSAVPREK